MRQRIGAYVAGELSGEEAHKVERFILEDPEALELAESYTRLLAFMNAVSRESPVPPPAILKHAVRWATYGFERVNSPSLVPAKDVARAGREGTRKEGRKSEG